MTVLDSARLRRHLAELGLEPGAGFGEVRSAYRSLAMAWHPDRFEQHPERRAVAEERIRNINAAFAWLDAHRALLGDRRGPAARAARPAPGPPRRAPPPKPLRRAVRSGLWLALPLAALGALLVAQPSETTQRIPPRASAPLGASLGLAAPRVPHSLPEAYVRAERLNVRAGSATDQPVLGVLEHGQRVLVTARHRGWSRVASETRPHVGWVKSEYLTSTAPAPPSTRPAVVPDLGALSESERRRVELACLDARFLAGDAAYARCLDDLARTVEGARVH